MVTAGALRWMYQPQYRRLQTDGHLDKLLTWCLREEVLAIGQERHVHRRRSVLGAELEDVLLEGCARVEVLAARPELGELLMALALKAIVARLDGEDLVGS